METISTMNSIYSQEILEALTLRYGNCICSVSVQSNKIPLSITNRCTVINPDVGFQDDNCSGYYVVWFYYIGIEIKYFVKVVDGGFDVATLVIRSFIQSIKTYESLIGGQFVLHKNSKDITLRKLCLKKIGLL